MKSQRCISANKWNGQMTNNNYSIASSLHYLVVAFLKQTWDAKS